MPLSRSLAAIGVSLAICCPITGPALSGTPPAAPRQAAGQPSVTPAPVEPDALRLIQRMTQAYASLSSLSGSARIQPPSGEAIQTTFRFQKPNRVRLTRKFKNGEAVFVSDGNTAYATRSENTKRYYTAPAHVSLHGILRQVQESVGVDGFQTILKLMSGEELIPSSNLRSLKKGEASMVEGVAVENLEMSLGRAGNGEQAKVTYSIGKDDHLLRKIAIELPGQPGQLVETYSDLRKNAKASEPISFTPPAGATAVSPPLHHDAGLKIGGKPFPLDSKDMEGQPISLDQYKGKVVLMTFWGTWCPACMAEMPAIISVYRRYRDKGFEVLGVALEDNINKARVQTYLKSKDLPWRQSFEGRRQNNPVAVRYGVRATPLSFLIGRDGTIVAIGMRGEKELEAAVQLALQKKG